MRGGRGGGTGEGETGGPVWGTLEPPKLDLLALEGPLGLGRGVRMGTVTGTGGCGRKDRGGWGHVGLECLWDELAEMWVGRWGGSWAKGRPQGDPARGHSAPFSCASLLGEHTSLALKYGI